MTVFDPRRPGPVLAPDREYPEALERFADEVEAFRRRERGDPRWSPAARARALEHAFGAYLEVARQPDEATVYATRLSPQVARTLDWHLEMATKAVESLGDELGRTHADVAAIRGLVESLRLDADLALGASEDPSRFKENRPRRTAMLTQARMLCRFFQLSRQARRPAIELVCAAAHGSGGTVGLRNELSAMVETLMDQTKPKTRSKKSGEPLPWPDDPEPNTCARCGSEWWGTTHSCGGSR